MDEKAFTQFRRTQIAEMRPYVEGETLPTTVSISAVDAAAGSPMLGDMIARNPANHDDQWLVSAAYFAVNFEPLDNSKPKQTSPEVSSIAGQILAKARDDDYVPGQDVEFIWEAAKSLAGSALSQDQVAGQNSENDHAE